MTSVAPSTPLISVVVLTRNEERHLPRALASLAGLAAEVFVVDSYSTDGTEEAARAGGASFVQHPFESHSAQLNWALQTLPLRGEWVMKLDADEYVEADLHEFLDQELATISADVHGVQIRCKQVFLGKWVRHGGVYPLELLRIWRRGSAYVQDKLMDEHVILNRGGSIRRAVHIANAPLMSVREFCEKHLTYAQREADDFIRRKTERQNSSTSSPPKSQSEFKALLKHGFYERLPFLIGPLLYWLYRVVIRSGWRDGVTGAAYHFLQGFWYRALVQITARERPRSTQGE